MYVWVVTEEFAFVAVKTHSVILHGFMQSIHVIIYMYSFEFQVSVPKCKSQLPWFSVPHGFLNYTF